MDAAQAMVFRLRGGGRGKRIEEGNHVFDEHLFLVAGAEQFHFEHLFQPEEKFGINAGRRFVFQPPEFVLRSGKAAQPQLAGELFERPAFALAGFAEGAAQLLKADFLEGSAHG